MHFFTEGDHLILQHMAKGLQCAKIQDWHSRLKAAWLISVNDCPVLLVKDINEFFDECSHLDHHIVPSYSHTQMYTTAWQMKAFHWSLWTSWTHAWCSMASLYQHHLCVTTTAFDRYGMAEYSIISPKHNASFAGNSLSKMTGAIGTLQSSRNWINTKH